MKNYIGDIGQFLKDNQIRPSVQRIKIFDFLQHAEDHPTVEDIYCHLATKIPTLSKTTVYNTLNLFIEKGIALQISIDENESRYDAKVDNHGHFMCEQCGSIIDFAADFSKLISDELAGFAVRQKHLYFKGICKNCQQNYTN